MASVRVRRGLLAVLRRFIAQYGYIVNHNIRLAVEKIVHTGFERMIGRDVDLHRANAVCVWEGGLEGEDEGMYVP